jgi:hypothetical protein
VVTLVVRQGLLVARELVEAVEGVSLVVRQGLLVARELVEA